ncbi:MAG: alpha/beta hydrolase [Clostridium sp.]
MNYTYEEKLKLAEMARNPIKKRKISEYQKRYIEKANIEEKKINTRHGKTKYYQISSKKKSEKSPLIITVHGGGFCNLHSEADMAFAAMIAVEAEAMVLDIDYRLAPEYPFPVAYEEVYDLTKWAYENAEILGIDKNKIILCGNSAGGNIVAATVMEINRTKEFKISLQILDYPPMDLYTDPENKKESEKLYIPFERARAYNSLYIRKEKDRLNPYISMVFAKEEMLKGMPDTIIITAEKDALHLEAEEYARILLKCGIKITVKKYLDSDHGFIVYCTGNEWLDAHKLIIESIKSIR